MNHKYLGIAALAGAPFLLLQMTSFARSLQWGSLIQISSGLMYFIAMACVMLGLVRLNNGNSNHLTNKILLPELITLVFGFTLQLIETKWHGQLLFPFSEICQAISSCLIIALCAAPDAISALNNRKRYIIAAAAIWLVAELAGRFFFHGSFLLPVQIVCSVTTCLLLAFALISTEDSEQARENMLYELSSL